MTADFLRELVAFTLSAPRSSEWYQAVLELVRKTARNTEPTDFLFDSRL